jgi:ABC-2 type transport system ATP-binding protein
VYQKIPKNTGRCNKKGGIFLGGAFLLRFINSFLLKNDAQGIFNTMNPLQENRAISIDAVYKSFGRKKVLEGVSLSLEKETVFGLVGLNGAGKTTLIRILVGLLRPDQGSCHVLGMNPADQEKGYYKKTGVILEHSGFFENLTVLDNIQFFAKAKGINQSATHDYFAQYWANTSLGKDTRKVKFFSRGQKMQCALCRAFLGWPEVYFFDEPAVALDMEAYDQFCTLVRLARERGATFIISSHQLETIEELCTRVGVIQNGRLTLLDTIMPGQRQEKWLVRLHNPASDDPEIKNEIGYLSRSEVFFANGYWNFTVSAQAEQTVAAIVGRLVKRGCAVIEVRPDRESFRTSIRQQYGKNT